MRNTLLAWATGILLGTISLAGPSVAQTAAGSGAASGARADAKPAPGQGLPKADPGNAPVDARCNSRKGADQKTCLDEVRAQQRAQGDARAARPSGAPAAMPAVQTQSSAVSATGVAPSTTGPDPTPGTPAMPRK